MPRTTAIVLAAGQGTRMKSRRAKVLHELCGKPMLHHVLDAALAGGVDDLIVVVGHDGDAVTASLASYGDRARTVIQDRQLGTGHAVGCALPALAADAELAMILCGDTPLVKTEDLARLASALEAGKNEIALLTCRVPDPTGYGRIIRDEQGRVRGIREHKDASEAERAIDEIN